MTKDEAEKLIATIRSLIGASTEAKITAPAKACDHKFVGSNKCAKCGERADVLHDREKAPSLERTERMATDNVGGRLKPFDNTTIEKMYQEFKARLIDEAQVDPVLLHLLMVRPELNVSIERRVLNLEGTGSLKGRVARVIAQGFLKEPRSPADIKREMMRTGPDVHSGDLGKALRALRDDGFLVAEGDAWLLAPGVKVTEKALET